MAQAVELTHTEKRQELSDKITNVESHKTPIYSMLKKDTRPAQKECHDQVEGLADQALTGARDGVAVTSSDYEHEARGTIKSMCQEFRNVPGISQWTNITEYGGTSRREMAHQVAIAAVKQKRNIERRIGCNTESSEDDGSSVANEMRGAPVWLQASAQSHLPVPAGYRPDANHAYSGTLGDFTEETLEGLWQAAFKDREGGEFDLDFVCGITLKQKFNNFGRYDVLDGANEVPVRTINQEAKDRAIIKVVDRLVMDGGTLRLHVSTNLYRNESTGAETDYTHTSGIAFDFSMWCIRWLSMPEVVKLTNDGDGEQRLLRQFATVYPKNPLGQFKVEIDANP